MSESPDNQMVLSQIVSEYRRLQRQLEDKTAQLSALTAVNGERGDFPTDFENAKNVRYSIDFTFKALDLQPQERSVQIRSGTVFRCKYMECFVRVVGSVDDFQAAAIPAQITLPWNIRVIAFDFFGSVRDTGTDREWMTRPQPSLFLGGGYYGPLWFPRRVVLGGGTNLFGRIEPFINADNIITPDVTLIQSVEEYIVQMSFVGHEVPEVGEL